MTRINDAIDRKLLSLLQANARESTTMLGRKLGIARTTVQERIARLQKNGTISGYSVVLRQASHEDHAEVAVLIATAHRRQKAVIEQLRAFPEVKCCQTTNADHDLLCRVKVAHFEDIQPVLEALAEIPGVERLKSMIVLATNFDRSASEVTSLAALQAAAMDRGEAG